MARAIRLELPGGYYHLISRGNARLPVFLDTDDHAEFIDLLGESCRRFHWRCHAYCLMPNHYHLLVELGEANLARGMRHLNGVFTQRYNRRHVRVGHLFQGRYRSLLLDHEQYLLELARYIVLNPVRAGLCAAPATWRWSSYGWLTGQREAPDWGCATAVWRAIHEDPDEARRRFAALVREGQRARVPGWSRDGILGSEEYRERMKFLWDRQRDDADAPVAQRFAERPSLETMLSRLPAGPARDQAMLKTQDEMRYTQAEISRCLGLSRGAVSRAIARARSVQVKT